MKVTLVDKGHTNLGLEYLSAVLKKSGHQVTLVKDISGIQAYYGLSKLLHILADSQYYKQTILEDIIGSEPELIAFSVLSDTYGWACEIAKSLKALKDIPIVFGGIHTTSVPEIVLAEKFIDYVCVGEGEEAMVELLAAMEKQEDTTIINNIWTKKNGRVISNSLRPLLNDLDILPFPDKEDFYLKYRLSEVYSIITGRGCLYNCTFCCNNLLRRLYKDKGVYLRRRSVDNVIAEIKAAKNRYKIKSVHFVDNIFVYNKEWLQGFAKKYREEIALPFMCDIHAQHIDKEVVELLELAGCAMANLGIQTVSEPLRREILKRFETNDQIIESIRLFKNSKISLYVHIILGLPDQDKEELKAMVRFFNLYRPELILLFSLRYYPRTEIIQVAKEKGILGDKVEEAIDKSKEYLPFGIGLSTADKEKKKLTSLILLSQVLPFKVVKFILEGDKYRYGIPLAFFYFHFSALMLNFYRKNFQGKRSFNYFSFFEQLRLFLYCGRKIIGKILER